jgi:hypothetical protein
VESLLILSVTVAFLSILFDRRIQARKRARLAAQTKNRSKVALRRFANLSLPRQKFWQRTPPVDPLQPMRDWVTMLFAEEPTIKEWLATLSREKLVQLMENLAQFCHELGFELTWLLDQTTAKQIETYREMKGHLQAVTMQYVRACYEASQAQSDLKVFQTWQHFEQNADLPEQQPFAQRLFAKLLEKGITPLAANALVMASPEERQKYIIQAIRIAAEAHPTEFQAILKEIVFPPPPTVIISQPKRRWFSRRSTPQTQMAAA